jgi:hypothetical protein
MSADHNPASRRLKMFQTINGGSVAIHHRRRAVKNEDRPTRWIMKPLSE